MLSISSASLSTGTLHFSEHFDYHWVDIPGGIHDEVGSADTLSFLLHPTVYLPISFGVVFPAQPLLAALKAFLYLSFGGLHPHNDQLGSGLLRYIVKVFPVGLHQISGIQNQGDAFFQHLFHEAMAGLEETLAFLGGGGRGGGGGG